MGKKKSKAKGKKQSLRDLLFDAVRSSARSNTLTSPLGQTSVREERQKNSVFLQPSVPAKPAWAAPAPGKATWPGAQQAVKVMPQRVEAPAVQQQATPAPVPQVTPQPQRPSAPTPAPGTASIAKSGEDITSLDADTKAEISLLCRQHGIQLDSDFISILATLPVSLLPGSF